MGCRPDAAVGVEVLRPGLDGDIETWRNEEHGCAAQVPVGVEGAGHALAAEARRDPAAMTQTIDRNDPFAPITLP